MSDDLEWVPYAAGGSFPTARPWTVRRKGGGEFLMGGQIPQRPRGQVIRFSTREAAQRRADQLNNAATDLM